MCTQVKMRKMIAKRDIPVWKVVIPMYGGYSPQYNYDLLLVYRKEEVVKARIHILNNEAFEGIHSYNKKADAERRGKHDVGLTLTVRKFIIPKGSVYYNSHEEIFLRRVSNQIKLVED